MFQSSTSDASRAAGSTPTVTPAQRAAAQQSTVPPGNQALLRQRDNARIENRAPSRMLQRQPAVAGTDSKETDLVHDAGVAPGGIRNVNYVVDDHPLVKLAEEGRQLVLGIAISRIEDLENRMLSDDPALKNFNPSKLNAGLDEKTGATIRVVSKQMKVYPGTLDWLHDPMADRFFDLLRGLDVLFIQNKSLQRTHVVRKDSVCDDPDTLARGETQMLLCPAFFNLKGKDYSDSMCPVLTITHEYFHYLKKPGTDLKIQHGENMNLQDPDWQRNMADAFRLANVAVQIAAGRDVDCQ